MENYIIQEERGIISVTEYSGKLEVVACAHRRVLLRRTDSSSNRREHGVQLHLKVDE